jgi:hypothetical protein
VTAARTIILLALVLWVGCAMRHDHAIMTARELPEAEAVALVAKRCNTCHSTELIYCSVGTSEEWAAVVHRMVYHHKAKLLTHVTDDEAAAIARWLGENQTPAREGVRVGYRPTGRPL